MFHAATIEKSRTVTRAGLITGRATRKKVPISPAPATLERVELRGCDLSGVRGPEALRGARMPWSDIVENAALFAHAAGVEIVD